MQTIQVVSDLHLEFNPDWKLPQSDNEENVILVLAGDIGLADKPHTFMPFLEDVANRFQDVVYILGNHEFYHGKFPTSFDKIKEAIGQRPEILNVHLLEKDSIVIFDVAFICATLWTNMNNHDTLCMYQSETMMNDYRTVRTGPSSEPWKRKLKPKDTVADHSNAKHYIFEEIVKQKDAGNKVMVVTHHGPSYLSVPDEFKGDLLNGAYVSELSEDIFDLEEKAPEVWVHGHTHNSFDYMIGKTRVVVNPRGYDTGRASDLNQEFDPEFRIDL